MMKSGKKEGIVQEQQPAIFSNSTTFPTNKVKQFNKEGAGQDFSVTFFGVP